MTNEERLNALLEGNEKPASRVERLVEAIELGASDKVLETLRDALRISRRDTIPLPPHHYEGLSRGRGWCRKGRGASAVWGEREDAGYRVGPGNWIVGGHDGFSRKGQDRWTVEHVQVGEQTWTIAN